MDSSSTASTILCVKGNNTALWVIKHNLCGSVVVVANEFSKLGVTGQNRLTAPFYPPQPLYYCKIVSTQHETRTHDGLVDALEWGFVNFIPE